MSTQDRKLFDLLDGFEMTKSEYDWLERRFENMTAKESMLFRDRKSTRLNSSHPSSSRMPSSA